MPPTPVGSCARRACSTSTSRPRRPPTWPSANAAWRCASSCSTTRPRSPTNASARQSPRCSPHSNSASAYACADNDVATTMTTPPDKPSDRVMLPTIETPTLTKAELADLLFERLGLNKREFKDMVEAFFEIIHGTLVTGQDVKLSSFGNFNIRRKAP